MNNCSGGNKPSKSQIQRRLGQLRFVKKNGCGASHLSPTHVRRTPIFSASVLDSNPSIFLLYIEIVEKIMTITGCTGKAHVKNAVGCSPRTMGGCVMLRLLGDVTFNSLAADVASSASIVTQASRVMGVSLIVETPAEAPWMSNP